MQALKIKEQRGKKKPISSNEIERNAMDLKETKRNVTAQKPLPKKFGAKIRHRDSNAQLKSSANVGKKKAARKGKFSSPSAKKGNKKNKKAKK